MFQRLRGAIDARIAEEQARQRSGQESLSRSPSGARRGHDTPVRRSSRLRRDGSDAVPARGPDPSEFDAAFVVGDDDDGSTRTSTPAQESEPSGDGDGSTTTNTTTLQSGDTDAQEDASLGHNRGQSSVSTMAPLSPNHPDSPTEVRVKLRRLDKLEGKYQELLKAYRIAHGRVLSIEPFEAALRENTPLTSISDPAALTEYLNQVSRKGDMVVDELKRVSTEKEDYKKKLDEAEKSVREAWDEVAGLKKKRGGPDDKTDNKPEESGERTPPTSSQAEDTPKSPTASVSSKKESIPGLSLFSPKKSESVTSPTPIPESEEFFSFDSELPRLESELKDKEQEVDSLNAQVKSLTGDLAVARESTESMVQSLESATRELTGLRESNERYESDLASQKTTCQERITSLESSVASAEAELEKSKSEVERLNSELKEKTDELANHGASNSTQNEETEAKTPSEGQIPDDKRLTVLQGVVENLKSQLKEAESTVSSLKEELSAKETKSKELQSIVDFVDTGLTDNDKWKSAKELVSNGKPANFDDIRSSIAPSKVESTPTPPPATTPAATGGKKKNNKKKKKGGASQSAAPESTEQTHASSSASVDELEERIKSLTSELAEKEAAIERLHTKVKGEDSLREEIESLRDDLLNIGHEHVESKDKVKELVAEKTALESTIERLEKELVEQKSTGSDNSDAEKAHESLTQEFEDLKIKATTLETDLTAAQQLAASRFKDMTELREALQGIQPELRTLRGESAELKTTKEELRSKTTELTRLEQRHEELRSEMKTLKSNLSDKDGEVKTLNQKIGQETSNRSKAEKALEVAEADLQYSEGQRQDAIEKNEKSLRDFSKTQEELRSSQNRLQEVEEQVGQLNRDIEGLREEIQLKTAQHASAQSLMNSMRDQTSEMAMQAKEARERCESLEEEVSEAHRLLSERSREGETMRRLLSDVEVKADIKVREIKERLDAAVEERDRAEEEASTVGRRRAREMEELKVKAREAERAVRRAEEDKEELEHAKWDWKRRREDLEAESERSKQELEDVKQAMAQLRDSLDESERQARTLEKDKTELRRSVDETNQRLEKLRKSNKSLGEELRSAQSSAGGRRPGTATSGIDSASRSPRSSIDSRGAGGGVTSPPPPGSGTPVRNGSRAPSEAAGQSAVGSSMIDSAYIKNVFLQFLEQKDKHYQQQLIPVLGRLLHFDSNDEQKWMSAISSKH